jgi:hypothetical protein
LARAGSVVIESEREARLIEIVRAAPTLMRVLTLARDLDLPGWRLVSGAVYQPVWNALTGRASDYGIKDYDLCYFDPDPSWNTEDVQIKRAAAFFPAPLAEMVEVRNQGRVHLWFEQKFGEPYAPLACTDDMLERFVCPAFAVGVRLMPDDRIDVAAPFGLEDLFAMRLRPNPHRPINPAGFQKVVNACRARWPEVTVDG